MTDQPAPSKFYKYRSMRGEDLRWVERTVINNELYFAPAIKFNDPFDLRPALSFDAPHAIRVRDYERLLRERIPDMPPERIAAEADRIVTAAFDPRNVGTTETGLRHDLITMLTERIGVYCVAAKRDDILMWSHYADSHRGICLEFDEQCEYMGAAQEVLYSERRTPLNRYFDDSDTMANKALLTKAYHWKYEAEWRSLRYDDGPGTVQFMPEHLTGIIIGANADNATVDKVIEWARARPTPLNLYRANVSHHEFELLIAPFSP